MKWYVGLLEGIMYISDENCFIGYGDKSFIDEGSYENMIKKYPTAIKRYEKLNTIANKINNIKLDQMREQQY